VSFSKVGFSKLPQCSSVARPSDPIGRADVTDQQDELCAINVRLRDRAANYLISRC